MDARALAAIILTHPDEGGCAVHDLQVMRFCVEAYLEGVKGMTKGKARLDSLVEQMDGLKSPRYGDVLTSDVGDKVGDTAAELVALEEEWADQARQYAESLAEAIRVCDVTMDHRWVCYRHYVDGWTWERCADEVGYSTGHVKNILAPRGIREIYWLMPERWRRVPVPAALERGLPSSPESIPEPLETVDDLPAPSKM